MKDIILFGIQGSGKGTQAKLLTAALPKTFSYFAMGDVFRALGTKDNAIGLYAKSRLAAGQLVDDKVVNSLFQAYMFTVIDDKISMLIDGYPRTIPQMDQTLALFTEHKREVLGIQFVIPDDIALERMMSRGRDDDTPEIMQHRIDQFYADTQPTIDYFAEHAELIQIDATKSINEIHEEVVNVIQ